MPRVRHIEDSPIPIRVGAELLAEIERLQKDLDLPTRSSAIRFIMWQGIRAIKEKNL